MTTASAEVADKILKVVRGKQVTLVLKDGSQVTGELDDYDAASIVITTTTGNVKEVMRDKLAEVKVAVATTATPAGHPPDLTPLCSLYDGGNSIKPSLRAGQQYASNDAKVTIQKIAQLIGMQSVPDSLEGNVPNAMATFYGQRRVIVYNSQFMDNVASQAGTRWAYAGILAHELGHHLNLHISASATADSWHQELQADYFSGFALAKMGASLKEAQSAMKTLEKLYGPSGSNTHPPTQTRLNEIEKGYRDGKAAPSASTTASDGTPQTSDPPPKPVPAPAPSPPPQAPATPVSVGFMLNGNVALRVRFVVDGTSLTELTNVPTQGLAAAAVPMPKGQHQLAVQGIAQVCNQMGCGTPFPVSGGPSPFVADDNSAYLVTGTLSPQGFNFALNRTQ
jgi:small nuclear ribonucleoprotein (snRNP)-like protein